VLTAVASVSEVIVTFLQLILFANTAAFFCSLLAGLRIRKESEVFGEVGFGFLTTLGAGFGCICPTLDVQLNQF